MTITRFAPCWSNEFQLGSDQEETIGPPEPRQAYRDRGHGPSTNQTSVVIMVVVVVVVIIRLPPIVTAASIPLVGVATPAVPLPAVAGPDFALQNVKPLGDVTSLPGAEAVDAITHEQPLDVDQAPEKITLLIGRDSINFSGPLDLTLYPVDLALQIVPTSVAVIIPMPITRVVPSQHDRLGKRGCGRG
jgi:hypothetical protein